MDAKQNLEISCWAAACQALASVAPRYGVTPVQVREVCTYSAQPRAGDPAEGDWQGDLLAVRRIAVGLIETLAYQGASKGEMLELAQEAFETHHLLQITDLPSEIISGLGD